ncbi:acid-sensing ion channel 4-A isoform X1 [Hydra vulgaris]|uniref:Acid-sensing ion channel 4-A isoform X1 n=1 Tax=Hydra vulgaris TaxID=6087 RepID=A0ABM4C1M1_HYDVU
MNKKGFVKSKYIFEKNGTVTHSCENKDSPSKKTNDHSRHFSALIINRILLGCYQEKLFWSFILILCSALVALPIYFRVQEYLSYESSQKISTIVTPKNLFPSVTICKERKSMFLYCDLDIFDVNSNYNVPCPRDKQTVEERSNVVGTGSYRTNIQPFEFYCDELRRKCSTSDLQSQFFKTVRNERGECVTWNGNGTYTNANNIIELIVKIVKVERYFEVIEVIVHEPQVDGTLQDLTFRVTTSKKYEISFTKVVSELLPAPYSNCINKKQNDIFPGKYTLENCVNSHNCISTFKKCGDTFDYCRKYIPESISMHYGRNNTISRNINCLKTQNETLPSICLLPCKQIDFEVSIFSEVDTRLNNNQFVLVMKNKNRNTYIKKKDKLGQTNNWTRLASEIAGLFSLVTGSLLICIIELFVYAVLSCF